MKIMKIRIIGRIQSRIAELKRELESAKRNEVKCKIERENIYRKRVAWLHRVLEQKPQAEVVLVHSVGRYSSNPDLTISISPFSGVIPKDIADDPKFEGRNVEAVQQDIERAFLDLSLIQMADGDTINCNVKEMDRMQDYLK
jgi:hypothetical protein